MTLRAVLSLLPVHTSTLGFCTVLATLFRVDSEMLLGILLAFGTPSEDAFWRKVLRSPSSTATLMPARMWVVSAPPIVSLPTIVGLVSHLSGSIPSLPSAPEFAPEPVLEEVRPEKLDSRRWKVAAGSW